MLAQKMMVKKVRAQSDHHHNLLYDCRSAATTDGDGVL